MKLKRSKMLWILLIGALLPSLLNFYEARHDLESVPFIPWEELFHNNITVMTLLMSPAILALFTGYVFAREYQERTVNNFLTSPRPRLQLLFAKYAVMLPVILGMLLLAFLLTLLSGFFLKHDVLTAVVLGKYLREYLLLLIMQYALISIAATVSIIGKNYIPAMGLGIFAVISELTIMQSKYIMYYPWSAPLNLLFHTYPQYDITSVGVVTLILAFVVPLLFNMVYYRKADVHSG